jgi:hypothetical protein
MRRDRVIIRVEHRFDEALSSAVQLLVNLVGIMLADVADSARETPHAGGR